MKKIPQNDDGMITDAVYSLLSKAFAKKELKLEPSDKNTTEIIKNVEQELRMIRDALYFKKKLKLKPSDIDLLENREKKLKILMERINPEELTRILDDIELHISLLTDDDDIIWELEFDNTLPKAIPLSECMDKGESGMYYIQTQKWLNLPLDKKAASLDPENGIGMTCKYILKLREKTKFRVFRAEFKTSGSDSAESDGLQYSAGQVERHPNKNKDWISK